MVSAICKGILTMKPIGQLDEKGLKEIKTIESWVMQLQKNQAVKVKA